MFTKLKRERDVEMSADLFLAGTGLPAVKAVRLALTVTESISFRVAVVVKPARRPLENFTARRGRLFLLRRVGRRISTRATQSVSRSRAKGVARQAIGR